MSLGLWQGEYEEMTRLWLRWRDEHGNWIPTPEEAQRQRADAQEQRAERLAARLRELGIDPNDID
jgi:non-ribosomal peptide synthetase component E (peptide arylation enzyme)